MKPSIGRVVHYVSRGSKDGIFESVCRAAVITEVHFQNSVGLAVLNPTGVFFGDAERDDIDKVGGTWHYPERVDE